ncbi:MAG: hypothetical protein WBX25_18795, partial [Rhodomicrobium sp.]
MVSLQDFQPLKPGEQKLLADALEGTQSSLGQVRPEAPAEGNEVRADFFRFLALGGNPASPVHESGLRIQGAYIDGAVNLTGARAVRPVWIQQCTINGDFSISDAETKVICLDGSSVHSIRGDGVKVDGSLLLRRTQIGGSLQLFSAEITGSFSCTGCTIEGRRWRSQRLAADLATITVGGNVELRSGFVANGLILLDDSEIGGTFDCSEGKFYAGFDKERYVQARRWDNAVRALKCHRLHLKGSLYLRDCACEGELSFSGAQIGGDIDCRHGQFRHNGNGDATALRFTRADAGGNIYLSEGFDADGKVQLNGVRLRGNMDCRGGTFSVPKGLKSYDLAAPSAAISEDAISLVNARVDGALILAPIERKEEPAAAIHGSLDLKSAHIRVVVDNPDAWPQDTRKNGLRNVIHLDGFTYERFAGNAPVDATTRRSWLKRQPHEHMGRDFRPQPFEQLIKVLREMGHPEEARQLAIERQGFLIRRRLARWRSGLRGALDAFGALIWAFVAGLLIGHGYRPLRVLFIMAGVGLACGYYFKLAAEQGVFAPRDSQVFLHEGFKDCRPEAGGNWTVCTKLVGARFAEYPEFNPWVYSFNVLLPVVDLQQEKSWVPMQKEVRLDLAAGRSFIVPPWGTNGLVLAELIFGWIASLLAVAAFSGLVKTD